MCVCVRACVHLRLPQPCLQGIPGTLGVVVEAETLLGGPHPGQGGLQTPPELLLFFLGHVTCLTKQATKGCREFQQGSNPSALLTGG